MKIFTYGIDPIEIILKYYPNNNLLRETLIIHSSNVARKAFAIASTLNDPEIDLKFIGEAAMLHDIGIYLCDAPSIHCKGTLPYICHGVEGSRILREEGLPKHALVCERHTGSGLSASEIEEAGLPLPHRDMIPLTINEKIICAADKFYSKSGNLHEMKSIDTIALQMAKFGKGPLQRWLQLEKELGLRKQPLII